MMPHVGYGPKRSYHLSMTTPAHRPDRAEMRHNLDAFKLHWRERLDC